MARDELLNDEEKAREVAISNALLTRDIGGLIQACAAAEFHVSQPASRHKHAAVHLLSLLIARDLEGARFLWRRLAAESREDIDTAAAWNLGRLLWRKERAAFYMAASSHSWGSECAPLVSDLVRRVRLDMFMVIQRAYSAIKLEQAAEFLGLSHDETARECLASGWTLEGQFLLPVATGNIGTIMPNHGDHGKPYAQLADGQGRAACPTVEQSIEALYRLTSQLVRLQTSS